MRRGGLTLISRMGANYFDGKSDLEVFRFKWLILSGLVGLKIFFRKGGHGQRMS